MIGWAAGALVALIGSAQAAEPVLNCQTLSDGSVQVRTVIAAGDATPEEIRAIVLDPVRCGQLVPDVVRTEVVARRGACEELVTTTRVPGSTLDYRSLRCRTQEGSQESLIESDYMTSFRSEWEVRQVEGGTEVTIRIRTTLNLPVPSAMVRMGLQTSMKTTMLNLIRVLAD